MHGASYLFRIRFTPFQFLGHLRKSGGIKDFVPDLILPEELLEKCIACIFFIRVHTVSELEFNTWSLY